MYDDDYLSDLEKVMDEYNIEIKVIYDLKKDMKKKKKDKKIKLDEKE